MAALLGGNVRVGLEDNLYLSRGVFATNGELVERAKTILEAMGATVIGPSGRARATRADETMSESRAAVGLLGGGVIGGGWAARFLLNGHDVRLYDPDPDAPRKVDEVLANARRAFGRLLSAPLPVEGP